MAIKEINEYRQFTAPAEVHKSINTLRGLVAGITTDKKIADSEIDELANWCMLHEHLEHKHPFSELLPLIRSAYGDGIITSDESKDILWLCNNFVSVDKYYDLKTSSLQFLYGMIQGMLSDGELDDDEIRHLQSWINANDFLEGCYPFDEIESLISSILLDGIITTEEREILTAFISNFIDTSMSYNINEKDLLELQAKYSISGVCSICQELNIEDDTLFCFTGKSTRASRDEIADIVVNIGGQFNNNVTKKTDYLIVGNDGNPCWAYACYGRKIEKAIELRKVGGKIKIINEVDFWDILEDL